MKKIDLVLFGATGYTGKFVARYIQRHCPQLKWAIVGRSQSKLSELTSELLKVDSTRAPNMIIADVNDQSSLVNAFKDTKLVLNCTGPYRFLGEQVVQACLNADSHYMDISGEPQFMEESFLKFHKTALEKRLLILHSCAFDSVPADFGVLHASRQFLPQQCSSVESIFVLDAPKGFVAHFTTYECAVHGLGDASAVRKIRKDIDIMYHPPKISHPAPKLPKRAGVTDGDIFHFDSRVNSHIIPFMGADVSVVRSSQRSLSMMTGITTWPAYAAYTAIQNKAKVSRYLAVFQYL